MESHIQQDNKAISHLRQAVAEGKHWYTALLEAIALWEDGQEDVDGQSYRYLIGGEAFDLRLLAKRLLQSADGLVPVEEKTAFLKNNQPPLQITHEQFKELIGDTKYKAYLNYFYGVTVENALISAVQKQINKELRMYPCCQDPREFEDTYKRIYGKDKESLVSQFNGNSNHSTDSIEKSPEFTYWLFKYRLNNSDKERIASDTQKGLKNLSKKQRATFWT